MPRFKADCGKYAKSARKKRPGNRSNPYHVAQETLAQVNAGKALEMCIMGHSEREIGRALGVTSVTAHNYIARELAEIEGVKAHSREKVRKLEALRMSTLLIRIMPIATKDNLIVISEVPTPDGPVEVRKEDAELQLKAVDRVIKISQRLAMLYGLDAPTKVDHTGEISGEIRHVLTVERQAELHDRAARLLERIPREVEAEVVLEDVDAS